ncbi:MAG: 16S rRNA (uracil(1498)-N(3))-methyltransferase [Candidatus Sericytochromatia bacterium]|nr:16S rRNA (uracil(1498)-N(3))-methyltransferase [Candidatus Sericytochromatia bacterium]
MSRQGPRPLPRFLEPALPAEAREGHAMVLGPERAHQIGRVLRMEPGDVVGLLDGRGGVWRARIRQLEARGAEVVLEDALPAAAEWSRPATLAVAVLKGDRQEWLIEKAVELGVPVLQPLLTARSVVRPETGGGKQRRWERLVDEATEQCERARRMELRPVCRLSDLHVPPGWVLIVADEAAETAAASFAVWQEVVAAAVGVVVCIGPEGGWTDEEREMFRSSGARVLSLGSTVLRAETAAVAAAVRLGWLLGAG